MKKHTYTVEVTHKDGTKTTDEVVAYVPESDEELKTLLKTLIAAVKEEEEK